MSRFWVLACALVCFSQEVSAEEKEWRPKVFIAGQLGVAMARIEHPEIPKGFQNGYPEDFIFGIEFNPRWSAELYMTQWLNNTFFGEPFHLHFFAPRVSRYFGPKLRAFASGSVGVALTDGNIVEKRGGIGAAALVGYRQPINKWISFVTEAGAIGHLYTEGNAFEPLISFQLRLYGSIPKAPQKKGTLLLSTSQAASAPTSQAASVPTSQAASSLPATTSLEP